MHREPSARLEHLVGDDVDGGVDESVVEVRQPALGRQRRAGPVARRERPADRALTLGEEQPFGGLPVGPELDVAEPGEVVQPWIGGVGDALDPRHGQRPARRRSSP
jgi:hypothetical protein